MYIGWQQQIFPYAPFDAFVEGLEKLGSSYVLKVQTKRDLISCLGGHGWSNNCCAPKHASVTRLVLPLQMELRELRSEVLKVVEKPQEVLSFPSCVQLQQKFIKLAEACHTSSQQCTAACVFC